jgi:hypothetical protein
MVVTHQHNQAAILGHAPERRQRVLGHGHGQALAEVDLAHGAALAGLGLGALDLAQAALLLRQGRLEAGVGVDAAEALGRQLARVRGKDVVAKVLGAELARERVARAGKEHLLAHGRRVGHVRHGDEVRRRRVPPQQRVRRLPRLQVRREHVEAVVERGRGGGRAQQLHRHQRLARDADDERKRIGGGEQLVELLVQLLGGCESWLC